MKTLTYRQKIRDLEMEALRQGVESMLIVELVKLAYDLGRRVEKLTRPATIDEILENNSQQFNFASHKTQK